MKYLSLMLLAASTFVSAQSVTLKINGCENNPLDDERLNEICEPKAFNILFYNDLNRDYIRDTNQQFKGNAFVQMVILEDGSIGEVKQLTYTNKTLALYGTKVLNNLKADFKKYNLSFEPILDQGTNKPTKFTHVIPIKIQF